MSLKKTHHIPKVPKELLSMVGKLLAAARKKRRWRQIDLAERLGISRYTITHMEQGDPRVSVGVYFTAAWMLDVPIISGMEGRAGDVIANMIDALNAMQAKRVSQRKETPPDDNF